MPHRRNRKRPVLMLNSSYEVLGMRDFNRAITMLVKGTAFVFEAVPDKFVQGPPPLDESVERVCIPWPVSIMLKHYVHVDHSATAPLADGLAANSAILHRDGFCCMYCGAAASTIDHVLPKSRGGENTWLNLVAACVECNGDKADRTPDEAGMQLIREPFVPDDNRYAREQKRVWQLLKSGKISVE